MKKSGGVPRVASASPARRTVFFHRPAASSQHIAIALLSALIVATFS
jgi:hypothetical protein